MNRSWSLLLLTILCVAVGARNTNAQMPPSGLPQILVPVAGHAPGSGGTFFRTDLTIKSVRRAEQRVEVRWLPSGAGVPVRKEITLFFDEIRSEDFVAEQMSVEGVGALLITAITATGDLDPQGQLYAVCRIWTSQPGTKGTNSQTIDVIPPPTTAIVQSAIFGLHRGSDYRLNIGIVNLDPANAHTFRVDVLSTNPFPGPNFEFYEVLVPAMAMRQIPLAYTSVDVRRLDVSSDTGSSPWVAFASSVDNATGAAWTNISVPGCCLDYPL